MNTAELRRHLEAGGAARFILNERAKFLLRGADRVRYLNGQVSNDVRALEAREGAAALPACVMNAKGKMNGFVWMAAGPEALWIDADAGRDPEAFREAFALRLERYIISDDAALEDATHSHGLIHVVGARAEALPPLPEGVHWRRSTRFGLAGVDFFGPVEPVEALARHGELEGAPEVEAETAEVFRIEQGVPRWDAELDENTLPAEAGLDAAAIDFHKGCYIGQEVISRIKSVGRVNRHLRGFVAGAALAAGAPVTDGEGRVVGVLTSAAWSFALDKAVALGYLRRGVEARGLVAGGVGVDLRPLPLMGTPG